MISELTRGTLTEGRTVGEEGVLLKLGELVEFGPLSSGLLALILVQSERRWTRA